MPSYEEDFLMETQNNVKRVVVLSICFLLLTSTFSSAFVLAEEDDNTSVEDTFIDETNEDKIDEKEDLKTEIKSPEVERDKREFYKYGAKG